jgi:hypothetical protein
MRVPTDLPEIALARVRTAGAPYRAGDTLSLAFTSTAVARLTLHERELAPDDRLGGDTFVPETIAVEVLRAAGPFAAGEKLMLSFVDPRVARIHHLEPGARRSFDLPARDGASEPAAHAQKPPESAGGTPAVPSTRLAVASAPTAPLRGAPSTEFQTQGVRIRLDWNADRVHRFVQLADKLFTVDRLGWYRHAFAMRLLVPDDISLADPEAEREARRHLRELRASAVETLGRPLLAAFMPSFVVTPEWLDSLDLPAAARALAGLRDAILPHLDDAPLDPDPAFGLASSVGVVERATFLAAPAGSVEALLPAFIATMSADEPLAARLSEYRRVLLELFGQTAQSAEAVRLKQMAQPNHVLDDRLWHLVGAVQAAFGKLTAV